MQRELTRDRDEHDVLASVQLSLPGDGQGHLFAVLRATVQYGQSVGVTVTIVPNEREAIVRLATAYQRRGVIFIHPDSRTTDGVWMFAEPCVRLPSDCSDVELGDAILLALEHSQSSVPHPHPNQWAMILEPLMKAAGVSGWKTFANGAVCVHVEADGGLLTAIPNVNHGARDGFKPDEANRRSITVPVNPDVVGAMVRAAIAYAR